MSPDFSSPPDENSSGRPVQKRRVFRLFVFAALPIALFGIAILYFERRPEISPVAHGEMLATTSGCFACHGKSDGDARANFRQVSQGVWKPKSIPAMTENGIDEGDVLKDWITNGVPEKEAAQHRQLFIQMPAYRDFLKADEIDAISAWILSEGIRISQTGSGAQTAAAAAAIAPAAMTRDQLFVAGDRLSRQHGCYQCHGELGQGRVANLASFKGYLPGFFGTDFKALTSNGDRDEILHWINEGRGRAIETGLAGPLAKHFFDGQVIQMPAYRDRLSDQEKNILTDFLVLLNKEGPLSAKQLEGILKLLNQETSDES